MINRSNILLKLKLKTNSFSFKIYMFWATKKEYGGKKYVATLQNRLNLENE